MDKKYDLSINLATDDNNQDKMIRDFRKESESKEKQSALLIVRVAGDSPKCTIAGFNAEGEFRTVVINNSNDALLEELEEKSINETRIAELAISSLNRTLRYLEEQLLKRPVFSKLSKPINIYTGKFLKLDTGKFLKLDIIQKSARNNQEKEQLISQFEAKYKSKKNVPTVLIVHVSEGTTEEWIVAGYNEAGEFRTASIKDSDDELVIELKKGEKAKKDKLIKLSTSRIHADRLTSKIYLHLDEGDRPIKIGDGQYGAVFEARTPNNDLLAVKILHKERDAEERERDLSSIDQHLHWEKSRDRFQLEAGSLREIRDYMTKPGRSGDTSYIVDHVGWSTSFPTYDFEKKFESLGLKLSNYALVTEKYDGTLKDLLEERGRELEIKRKSASNNEEKKQIISQFKFEYESKKDVPAILTVDVSTGTAEEWIVAGYNEAGKFKTVSINDADDELVIELKKAEKANEEKLIKLATSRIPRRYQHSSSGYDILAQLDFDSRIGTILPILRDIAEGLSIMHDAGYVHLDVKPANIFWRRQGVRRFHAAIGDLGYIRKWDKKDFHAVADAALGTLHYRSPEQKDFEDVCEVDVLGQNQKGLIVLETADPKFDTTIVEKGDALKFLKAKERDFRVHHIERADEKERRRTRIYIEEKDRTPFPQDFRTQVVMYKRQGIRTDLFGFGAITYDLLTCGDSPERFYNYLIAFDREGEDVGPILGEYRRVATYQEEPGREPAYASIFGSFFDPHESEYAPPELVRIVLRTMLYKSAGTYFAEHGQEAFKHIVKDLKELEKSYTTVKDAEDNFLISKTRPHPLREKESNQFRELVEKIQQTNGFLKGESYLIKRICLATARFRQILILVKETFDKLQEITDTADREDVFYFAELAPENIEIRGDKLKFRESVSVKEYLKDLSKDRLGTVRFPPRYVSPFWPPEELGYLRRRIELHRAEGQENHSSVWQYRFLEASPLGDKVQENDWIVGPDKELRMVLPVEGKQCITLGQPVRLEEKENASDGVSPKKGKDSEVVRTEDVRENRAVFYRGICRGSYYLDMLGRYIYQLFFVGIADNDLSEPISVQSVKLQLKASPGLAESLFEHLCKQANSVVFEEGVGMGKLVTRLYRRLASLYLILAVPQLRNRFGLDEHDRIGSGLRRLDELWHDLAIDFAICLQLDRLYLTEPGNVLREDYFKKRICDWEKGHSLSEKDVNLSFAVHVRALLTKQRDMHLEEVKHAIPSLLSRYNPVHQAEGIEKKHL